MREWGGGDTRVMKEEPVYLRKCFMASVSLHAGPENSRILRVNVGAGRSTAGGSGRSNSRDRPPSSAPRRAWSTEAARGGADGKHPARSWLSSVRAALVLQEPDRPLRHLVRSRAGLTRGLRADRLRRDGTVQREKCRARESDAPGT